MVNRVALQVRHVVKADITKNDKKGGKTVSVEVIFGQRYADRRTHRTGTLISYDDKYRTYLLESLDGKSFNITSSQFNKNWELTEEVVEVEPIEVEQAEVSKARYTGPSEEKKEELNKTLETFYLVARNYVDEFQNEIITIKPEPHKRRFLMKVRHRTVFIVDCLLRQKNCRVWLREYASDLMSWTVKPISIKRYAGTNHNTTVEFPLENLNEVLDDLKAIVIQDMTEMEEKRNGTI